MTFTGRDESCKKLAWLCEGWGKRIIPKGIICVEGQQEDGLLLVFKGGLERVEGNCWSLRYEEGGDQTTRDLLFEN